MHVHEEPEAAPTADPARARVTAEELAAAVAVLEARKAEGLSSTIAIGEAIQELRLDAAPEEIWAEVQAHRADKAIVQAAEEKAFPRRAQAAPSRVRFQGVWSRQRKPLSVVMIALVGVLVGTRVVGSHLHDLPAATNCLYQNIAEIPDGVPVYARAKDISDITHGRSPAVTTASRSKNPLWDWVVVRHDGKIYARGYALSQSASTECLSLYSTDGVGELLGKHTEYVTIPLKDAHWGDVRRADGWEEITFTNAHPDAHFHDH